jgi:hypothetical protein
VTGVHFEPWQRCSGSALLPPAATPCGSLTVANVPIVQFALRRRQPYMESRRDGKYVIRRGEPQGR